MPSKILKSLVSVLGAILITGCVSTTKTQAVKVAPLPPPPAPTVQHVPAPPLDPIATLIAESDTHFEAGHKELAVGHLEGAKTEFNRALDTLLESREGARINPRLREHFDRLVDRISVLEQAALATGDGFSETKSEPAAIDSLTSFERLAAAAWPISVFPQPGGP